MIYNNMELFENKKCKIIVIDRNYFKKDISRYTEQLLIIIKDDQHIVLFPEDLEILEKAIGAKFKS